MRILVVIFFCRTHLSYYNVDFLPFKYRSSSPMEKEFWKCPTFHRGERQNTIFFRDVIIYYREWLFLAGMVEQILEKQRKNNLPSLQLGSGLILRSLKVPVHYIALRECSLFPYIIHIIHFFTKHCNPQTATLFLFVWKWKLNPWAGLALCGSTVKLWGGSVESFISWISGKRPAVWSFRSQERDLLDLLLTVKWSSCFLSEQTFKQTSFLQEIAKK